MQHEYSVEILQDVLRELVVLHKDLYEVCLKEKQHLIQLQLAEAQNVLIQKTDLLSKIQSVEQKRLQALHHIQNKFKLSEEVTLKTFIEKLKTQNDSRAMIFENLLEGLIAFVERIQSLQEETHAFILSSLEHLEIMKKNIMAEVAPHQETYGNSGKKQSQASQPLLLSKEV